MSIGNRFLHYQHAVTAKAGAYQQYNYASTNLELHQIQERSWELASQSFASVAKGKLHERIGEITDREREIGIAFARYATCGRTDEA